MQNDILQEGKEHGMHQNAEAHLDRVKSVLIRQGPIPKQVYQNAKVSQDQVKIDLLLGYRRA
jgi:hypothetical protein